MVAPSVAEIIAYMSSMGMYHLMDGKQEKKEQELKAAAVPLAFLTLSETMTLSENHNIHVVHVFCIMSGGWKSGKEGAGA